VRFALIGLGYWGRNYARLLSDKQDAELVAVCDTAEAAVSEFAASAPSVRGTTDFRDAVAAEDVEAVVVATPASTHYDIVREALLNDKHVLCEKPLATSTEACRELIELAEERERVVFVGHTFIFNAAVRAARELVSRGELGKVRHCTALWTAPGPVRHDVNALWDLAPHPISILVWLFGPPVLVQARGQAVLNGREREDVAFAHVRFADDVAADIHVSWVAPIKVRSLTITGDRRVAVFDDMAREGKLQLFDTEAALKFTTAPAGAGASARTSAAPGGPVHVADASRAEPLGLQLDHFFDCCLHGITPDSNAASGTVVVRVLEAAQESLESDGGLVHVTDLDPYLMTKVRGVAPLL
jgi:predicted dehydrogenase